VKKTGIGDGFLLVDKDQGWTSHDVVAKVRGLIGGKVGHAGTLDPMATGLLILGLGKYTRLLRYVQGLPKQYRAAAQFGVATDSLDADGAVIDRAPLPVTMPQLETAAERFRGPILQIPPMVSARKIEGRRLYELARAGKVVEREARSVEIYELNIIDLAPSDYPEVTFDVVCSTGTYVRTLGDDLARAVGGRAHLTALRRIRNGPIDVGEAVGIATVEEAVKAGTIRDLVATSDVVLADIPARVIPQPYVTAARNGAAVPVAVLEGSEGEPKSGLVRLVADGSLVGVYRIDGSAAKAEVVTA
jgi:tRNA pseudouridine55 synthase